MTDLQNTEEIENINNLFRDDITSVVKYLNIIYSSQKTKEEKLQASDNLVNIYTSTNKINIKSMIEKELKKMSGYGKRRLNSHTDRKICKDTLKRIENINKSQTL